MRKRVFILLIGLLYLLPVFSQELPRQAKLVEALNSSYDEYRPCVVPNGKTIYFSRKGDPLNIGGDDHYDVWVAFMKSNGNWGKAVNLGTSINDKSDNSVVGTNVNGDKLYLTNARYGLTYSQKRGRTWSMPKPVRIEGLKLEGAKINFHLSGNGMVMLLSMPSKDSYGGRDLYVSRKNQDESWSAPQNLGTAINSNKEEYFAALAEDGKTLYFLSNGQGDDPTKANLYMSRSTNSELTEWEEPKPLNIELNPQTIGKYFSISPEGDEIFCSASGANGDDEIISIRIASKFQSNPTIALSGHLIDAETGEPIKGEVKLQTLSVNGKIQQQETKKDGSYRLVIPRGNDIGIYAERSGYFAMSETMTLSGQELEELDQETMTADSKGDIGLLSPEAEQLQLRLNKVNDEFVKLANQRRREAQEAAKQVRRTKGIQRDVDPELESLKHRYVAITGQEEEEVETVEDADEELAALKRKFRKHNDVTEDKGPTRKENETELEAMKRKFNEENGKSADLNSDEELLDMTVTPSETQETKSFDELVENVWYALEGELVTEVSHELKTDLVSEVASEIKNDMDPLTRKGYVNKFQRMATLMESESKKELRKKYKAEVRRELKGELMEEVEEELREALREEVKQELRLALREEVRQELRIELEYQIKKEILGDLQKELKSQIRKSKRIDRTPQTPRFDNNKAVTTKGKKIYKEREELDIKLYKLTTGQIIPLKNIFFKANKANIKEDLSTDLNRVLDLLKKNPTAKVEIGGHTNGWCSVEFANKLSSDRAAAIANYLIENGANADQIVHHGYGRSRPLVPNDSLENCKKNQRVELKIIKI